MPSESTVASCGWICLRSQSYSVSRAHLRPRNCLERVVRNLILAEIVRGEMIRHPLDAGRRAEVAARIADKPLRILRRAAGIVAGHAVEHLHELVGIVGGGDDAVEI